MADGGKRLLIGCGLGCGALILIGALLVGSGVLWVRDLTDDFGGAVELRAQLDERFGEPVDWTPPADGRIPAERVEAFLAMREASAPARARIADTMSAFALSEQRIDRLQDAGWFEQMKEVLRITRTGFDLPDALGEYFKARNRGMLDAQLGYPEYAYLYAIGYWSFLGLDPEDGPKVVTSSGSSITVSTERNSIGTQASIVARVRDELSAMLTNQLAACDALPGCDAAWRTALADEIAALRDDPFRMPWPDGPPEPLAGSLAPYRERLAASYEPATNPFELARNRQRGRWSIQSE